jgi:hypothetical protein
MHRNKTGFGRGVAEWRGEMQAATRHGVCEQGFVRRVIRRIGTDRFVEATGEETTHFENGKMFNGFADAFDFCARRKLEGVELVLLDESGQEQVCITLV